MPSLFLSVIAVRATVLFYDENPESNGLLSCAEQIACNLFSPVRHRVARASMTVRQHMIV